MILGRGGIREIEFFTQIRQLIAAGRDPNLRGRQTLPALQALTDAGWVKAKTADCLTAHYKTLRYVEHALQMVRDRQTQAIPDDAAERGRIAALMGQSLPEFEAQLFETFSQVHKITDRFFAPAETEVFDVASPLAAQTAHWKDIPTLQNETAAKLFDQVLPSILRGLEAAADPNAAVRHFESFLRGIPSGVQVFSLFAANPSLVQFITKITAASPALADYLGYNARVLDAVVSGDFFGDIQGKTDLAKDLDTMLSQAAYYEAKLIAARAWKREWHFRIGAHLIDGLISPAQAAQHYSNLADVIVDKMLGVVLQHFSQTYGTIADAKLCVVGMGSLGASLLSSNSDLDLLVIFDADPNLQSDGRRSLPTRVYFARLTQSLITALTSPMPGGVLYEVDMRLRPSGKAGPVATHIVRFEDYYASEAWTWEHLALTRARPIAGNEEFCRRIEQTRQKLIRDKAPDGCILNDVADMRRRLAQEKPQKDIWDVKNGPGGTMDIELFAQSIALKNGSGKRKVIEQLALFDHGQDLCDPYIKLMNIKLLHAVLCKSNVKKSYEIGAGAWGVIKSHCNIANEDQLIKEQDHTRQVSKARFDAYISAGAKNMSQEGYK
ncbi:MAG: [protein-PII] uridylyltransferase family protein [Planktomarina sp.]